MLKGMRRCVLCRQVFPKTTFPIMRGKAQRISRLCFSCQETEARKRFWKKVDKESSIHGCWLWTASKWQGYGLFSYQGHCVSAHRLAWEWEKGPIPEGMHLCHNCPGGDNPSCVNPEHHFLGTCADNIHDAMKKGISFVRHSNYPQGETHHMVTHSKEQVMAIRALAGTMKQRSIAKATGTTEFYVSLVLRRKIWAHIP